ncbi:hypothetical protein [Bartonella raoultii]|uniref:Lipoprotein n=1 Tax=Bartonella raoultii TaxID=1457020 RepID=A0ABS7I3L0_9HYPH|nr:hypothetical protein [Bartonella raoultii]MBX4335263.1 hypothetical protein [Bartonella raoultii]
MLPLVFILLLVSCTDDFNSCYSNKTMAQIYPTAQACEQAMIPSTKKFSSYGQQIFAQCTSIHANLQHQTVTLTWFITNRGNFLLKSQTVKDKVSAMDQAHFIPISSPLLHLPAISPLHKKP